MTKAKLTERQKRLADSIYEAGTLEPRVLSQLVDDFVEHLSESDFAAEWEEFCGDEPMPEETDDESGVWFALANDGVVYCLCGCGDFEAAEESAKDLGIETVWIANPKQAKQWQHRLNDNIDEDPS